MARPRFEDVIKYEPQERIKIGHRKVSVAGDDQERRGEEPL